VSQVARTEEFPLDLGAVNQNSGAGFHLDQYPYINAFSLRASVLLILVDNQSAATIKLITDPSKPSVGPGERKAFPCRDGTREAFFEASGSSVSAGQVTVTLTIDRGA
jgi:hypothetical protein